jgi:glycerol-3-phosphate dehydrogenase
MKRDPGQLSDREFDLLVVGGGIYGACILWDAALRGLSAALVDRGDFGQATSANSLKIVHGGLRYLRDADISLVRMMNKERTAFLQIAPHLVHPLPCLIPTDTSLKRNKVLMGLALKLNDLAGYDRNRVSDPEKNIPDSSLFSFEEYFGALPNLPDQKVTGGAHWHDGQIYDTERLTLSFVRSAAESGAAAANYVEAGGLLRDGNKVYGVRARDVLSGACFDIRAKVVVNAAGPWVDQFLEDLNFPTKKKNFIHSLAVNLITKKLIDNYAVGIPSQAIENTNNGEAAHKSQMLFISPWRGHSMIGTFHSHYNGNPGEFQVSEQLLLDALGSINSAYPKADLELKDISFVHHGFLPEKEKRSGNDVDLIRKSRLVDHRKQDGIGGLITVVGVKYTTARKAAEKAVDLVFDYLGEQPPPSKTQHTQLHAGQIDRFEGFLSQIIGEESAQIDPAAIDHLVRSYGTDYRRVRELIDAADDTSPASVNSKAILQAQVLFAIGEEMAVKLSDVILRRTGLGTTGRPEDESLLFCADVMAAKYG